MARRPTDLATEECRKGDMIVTTRRQGWFGTSSYAITVVVSNAVTGETLQETNQTPFESPRMVRQRALVRAHDEG